MEKFYELCGGIECNEKKRKNYIKILSPDEVMQSSHFVLGGNEGDTLCPSWYLIAQIEDGKNVFIDFSEEGSGKCYIYTKELPDNWSMLTKNFTEFLLYCMSDLNYESLKGEIRLLAEEDENHDPDFK